MNSSSSSDGINENGDDIKHILENYKKLLKNQSIERNLLLDKVNEITQASKNVSQMDHKMDNLVKLLLDIKQQIVAISSIKSEIKIPNNDSLIDEKQLEDIAVKIEEEGIDLSEKIINLQNELNSKERMIIEKDNFITELNEQLELLAFEKSQLVSKLNNLNEVTAEWNEQINMLQKLAVSDPRYKAIDTLKKHGMLSEIQLAFSMGTSIGQVKRYADDLIKLNLIKRDNNGRYVWIGENE